MYSQWIDFSAMMTMRTDSTGRHSDFSNSDLHNSWRLDSIWVTFFHRFLTLHIFFSSNNFICFDLSGDLIEAWPKIITRGKENMKCEKFFHLYNSEHNTRRLPHACHYKKSLGTTAQLLQSESRLTYTRTNYLRMWSRQTLWIPSKIGWTRNGAFKVQRTSQPVINVIEIDSMLKAHQHGSDVTRECECGQGIEDTYHFLHECTS